MKPRRVGLSDMLRNVAAATGNQHYAELAMEAAALEEET